MVKLALKRYLKNPALLIMSVIYFVFVLYIFCVKNCHEALDPFIVVMGLGQITFLFFMFLSYEYFSEARRADIEEVIRISYRGLHWFKLSGMVVLVVLDGMVCLLFYLYQVIIISRLEIHNVKYMFFLGTGVMVHHLLAYFFAAILGMATSYIKSRTKGYCVLLLVYFVTSGQMILILHSYFLGKSLSYRVADLLDLFNREFGAIRDFYYIYSMEAVNLQRILFWIFLAGMILVFVMTYGKRKVFTIIPGVGMIICAWL